MNAERGLVMLDAKANPETEAVLQELAGAGA